MHTWLFAVQRKTTEERKEGRERERERERELLSCASYFQFWLEMHVIEDCLISLL